jgi:putative thioredoxin
MERHLMFGLQKNPNSSASLPSAPDANDFIHEGTIANFRQDVIAESLKRPVLVDFWAPWCGPCKNLAPVLEKLVKAASGKIRLVKINIDEHPKISAQLGIQSIPALIAFQKGQPVDGFMGALPEGQIKGFIERLIGPLEPSDSESETLATQSPLQPVSLPDTSDLVEQVPLEDDTTDLQQRIASNPLDYQARLDLAIALNTKGQREEAADQLLEIIRRDRNWEEDGARKKLVEFFEIWGAGDEATLSGRRRLSSILFA